MVNKKYLFSMLVGLILAGGPSPQSRQLDPRLNLYRVSGKVVFKKSQSPRGATVYVMGTRPINGRLPFTHADKNGRFVIEFSDLPDDYSICAQPGETGGLLPLAQTPKEARKMPIKLTCSKAVHLDAENREYRVQIRLR